MQTRLFHPPSDPFSHLHMSLKLEICRWSWRGCVRSWTKRENVNPILFPSKDIDLIDIMSLFSSANLCRDVFCTRVELIGKRRYFLWKEKWRFHNAAHCTTSVTIEAKFERKSDKKCVLFFLSRSQNMSCFLVFFPISPPLHPAINNKSNRKNIFLSIEMFSTLFLPPPPLCLWSCFQYL